MLQDFGQKTTLFCFWVFDLIFILNFVYASQFVFYVVVYTNKTIRQLGLVVYERIVDSGLKKIYIGDFF